MSFLLPSDMGRLIYGYLQASCSEELAEEFLNTSDSMRECRKYRHTGFNATVHDRTLTQMLTEYSLLSDLIFEQCNVNERSHFNVVNTLQNLLKSKVSCARVFSPTDAAKTRPPDESKRKKTTCTVALPVDRSISLIDGEGEETSHIPVSARGSALMPEILSSPKCSVSTRVNGTIMSNKASANAVTVKPTVLSTSPSKMSVPIPSLEEQLTDLIPDPVTAANSMSHSEDTIVSGLSKSVVRTSPINETSSASSPVVSREKFKENVHDSITCNDASFPIVQSVSPERVSQTVINNRPSLENVGTSDLPTFTKNVAPCISTTSISSIMTPKKNQSSKFDVPVTNYDELNSSVQRKSEELENLLFQSTNVESILRGTPLKDSPLRNKESARTVCNKARIPKRNSEIVTSSQQNCNPVEIAPKVVSSKSQQLKTNSPISEKKKNLDHPSMSQKYSRESRPWDYGLRQAVIIDSTDDVKTSNDSSKEYKKNRTKKDDSSEKNSRTPNNKRKHERKPIICKKQKKLEEKRKLMETRKDHVEGRSTNALKQVPENTTSSSRTTSERKVEDPKRISDRISDITLPETMCSKKNVLESQKSKFSINKGDAKEEDFSVRKKMTEEIVLFYKVGKD